MKTLRDTWLIFERSLSQTLRNPVWVVVGLVQPLFFLFLFGPLLEPVISQLGGNKYTWFVPGMLVQLGIFGAFFAGFSLIGEWREGVIEDLAACRQPVSDRPDWGRHKVKGHGAFGLRSCQGRDGRRLAAAPRC